MKHASISKMDNQVDEINYLAIQLLERIGVIDPTQEQIEIVEGMISNSTGCIADPFDKKLSAREAACLYWAAQGKSSQTTASLLGVSQATIEWMRKRIKHKLRCVNITHAVFKGVQQGYIKRLKAV